MGMPYNKATIPPFFLPLVIAAYIPIIGDIIANNKRIPNGTILSIKTPFKN
jgi:hypothetical protein